MKYIVVNHAKIGERKLPLIFVGDYGTMAEAKQKIFSIIDNLAEEQDRPIVLWRWRHKDKVSVLKVMVGEFVEKFTIYEALTEED